MWNVLNNSYFARYSSNSMYSLRVAFIVALFFIIPFVSHAAILSVFSETNELSVGQEVAVDVIIDTEEIAINAAQATITFPAETLEVSKIDFLGSVFNFWVEEPFADNDAGIITFIGGTARGITGEDLKVATITFKSLGSGLANITPGDAVITASDGKGTNVLSSVEGTTLNVDVTTFVPESEFDPSSVVAETVEQVTRTATAATGFPAAPSVMVPLYPDPAKWYKHIEPVTVFWEIPDDVTKVAVEVDGKPNTEPSKAEEGLFTGKELGVFEEGETYIHVQFKNNIGWGPVTHYRVAIDTVPPTPFIVEFEEPIGDDPTPTLFINSFDARSGIDKILISIDDSGALEFASTTITLPPQKPGVHTILVRVLDKARNNTENTATFDIGAIPTPSISFITRNVSQSEQGFLSGNAIPGGFVDIEAFNIDGERTAQGTAISDESGNWRFVFEEILPLGRYTVVVTARDQRGAVSYPTEPETIRVRPETILSLGFIDLGWFEILLIVVLGVVTIVSFSAWFYVREQGMQAAYAAIAARDVKKFGDLILNHLNTLETSSRSQSKGSRSKVAQQLQGEIDHSVAEIKELVKKMNKYLVDLINKS